MNDQLVHPEAARLEAFARGELEPSEIDEVQRHLADCQSCCHALDEVPDDNLLALVRRAGTAAYADETMVASKEQMGDDAPTPGIDGTVVDPTASPSIPDLPTELAEHARYRVLELIGRGGMGDVYRAEHRMMQRTVALKVIKRELTQNPQAVERFEREVRAAASLAHANIVAAYDAERAGNIHFLAMEYVEGTDLAEVVKQRGQISVADACDYIRQAAEGLGHAHEQGLVHRDIKPHNLMLTAEGTVKILDFGLASLTEGPIDRGETVVQRSDLTAVGTIMGTPDYISPEQATNARAADIRSDIYSLGATLYFLLAGRPPFDEGTIVEKLKSHAVLEAERIDDVRVDVSAEVADVIRRTMSKDPGDRFQTPSDLANALAPFVEKHRTDKSVVTGKQQLRPGKRATVWPRVAAAALLLVVVALGVILYVVTDKGTLVINAQDENVQVVIRKAGEVEIVDTVTGSKAVRLPSGKYEIALKGDQNEFSLDGNEFTLTRGAKKIVTVRRKLPVPELPTPENAIINSIGMRLVPIPAGEFMMGSPKSEKGRSNQEQPHLVKITKPVYMGMCEVTQQEYLRVMGGNPSEFSASAKYKDQVQGQDTSRFPVEHVSWKEAMEFCRRLSERPEERYAGLTYRLPTEALWEYACRAGTTTPFHFGSELNGTQANSDGNHPYGTPEKGPSLQRTTAVGSYRPNAFGLYDMHGNVWEWCSDWSDSDYYAKSPVNDPPGAPARKTGFAGGPVVRGGSWNDATNEARSAHRSWDGSTNRLPDLGLRVVCELRNGREAAIAKLARIAAINEAGGKMKFGRNGELTFLSFWGSRSKAAAQLTDADLVFLRGLNNLETLYLVNTKVTDAGLEKHFTELTSLKNLYLVGTKVGDAGVETLKRMDSLWVLYLDSTHLTDAGLEQLTGMTMLDTLSLNGTKVTDAGLEHLKRMTNLSRLELRNTKVTDAGIQKLQQALPNCRIDH